MGRIAALAATLLAAPVLAADGPGADDLIVPAEGRTLDEYLWVRRPVVVFADNPADPRYVQQMQYITDRADAPLRYLIIKAASQS